MFDIKKYREKKEKGLVELVSAGDSYAVATKKFDPETGAVLPDEVVGVNLIEIEERKVTIQEEIVEIDAFVADCKSLSPTVDPIVIEK